MTDKAGGSVACYYCGNSLSAAVPGRLDECTNCGRYVHVCRMCLYYDRTETSKQCSEDDAEEVRDKQAANFCDYFKLTTNAFDAGDIRADAVARSELTALFGDAESGQSADQAQPSDESRLLQDADALFRK